jgi:hypothetical protein
MSCNINSNIALDCIDSAGSIVRAFVLNGPADSFSEAAGNVSAITVGGSAVAPGDWFTWDVPRQTSGYEEVATVSVENGTLYFEKNLSLFFNKMDAAKRNELLLAAQNQSMIVAFEDANGVYWVFGLSKGVYTSSATAATGATFADRNGYTVVLTSQEVNPAFTIDAALIVA